MSSVHFADIDALLLCPTMLNYFGVELSGDSRYPVLKGSLCTWELFSLVFGAFVCQRGVQGIRKKD